MKVNFLTDKPQGFVTLVSCDPVYMRQHIPAFLASCGVWENDAHVNIINPEHEDEIWLLNLMHKIRTKFGITVTASYQLQIPQNRVHYAINRFMIAPDILRSVDDLFISDVDAMFMKHMYPIGADVGLFLREPLAGTIGWEQEGTRVAAGAVFFKKKVLWLAELLEDEIHYLPKEWFVDQIALNNIYQNYLIDSHTIPNYVFDEKFMDWEFVEGTTLWTGKGARKYDNPVYLAKKKEYEEMLK